MVKVLQSSLPVLLRSSLSSSSSILPVCPPQLPLSSRQSFPFSALIPLLSLVLASLTRPPKKQVNSLLSRLATTRRGRGVVHYPLPPPEAETPNIAHARWFWQTSSFLLAGLVPTPNLEKALPRFNRLSQFNNAAISHIHAQPLPPLKGVPDVPLQRAFRSCSSPSAHKSFRKGKRPHALRLSFPLCRCFSQVPFHSSYALLLPYLTRNSHSTFSRSFFPRSPQRQRLLPVLEAHFHSFVSGSRHSLPR